MVLWDMWLHTIGALIDGLSSGVGLGLGLAIVATTLLLRTALLPVSWNIGYRNSVRQKKLTQLQPEFTSSWAAGSRRVP